MAGRTDLLETSSTLQASLRTAAEDIPWAEDAAVLFDGIRSVYQQLGGTAVFPEQLLEAHHKASELERYLIIDIHRHIALGNGRPPYHLHRLHELLTKINSLLAAMVGTQRGRDEYEGPRQPLKDLEHVKAELQTVFLEYGFCSTFEVLYNIDEANRRLDGVDVKLRNIERSLKAGDTTAAIVELHDAIADQHGIQQVLTEGNMSKIHARYDDITSRITRLENTIYTDKLQNGSSVFDKYIQILRHANQDFISVLYKSDPVDIINDNMIHPGTRSWLLERIQRFMYNSKKRVFYLGGREGAGKTAMASTICKLYGGDVIGEHFFSSGHGDHPGNHVTGLIQSLAADMCRTWPEYQQYLTGQYGSMGPGFRSKLTGDWETLYDLLLRAPLTAIYGPGKAPLVGRRKLIVIDGLDEVPEREYSDVKAFLTSYMRDTSPNVCIVATVRTEVFSNIVPLSEDFVEGIKFEDRAFVNRHIKDIEIYLAGSLGAILSGEDEGATPGRAKADEMTLQNAVDELLKNSAGRFDYAIELMEAFATEMNASGQFLTSLKRALMPVRHNHQTEFEEKTSDFASPFRAYRDKEGRSVSVRVMRQSQYPMDKSRVALIRGRHKIKDLQN